jgi:flagellar hook-associated protein 2
MAYISALYDATFGTTSSSGILGINPSSLTQPVDAASLVNLAIFQQVSNQLGGELASDQVRISDLASLAGAVSAFQSAMQGLKTAAQISPAAASSANSTVATTAAAADAQLGTYDLVISQLAAAETAQSAGFADADTTVVGTGTLSIQLGSVDGGDNFTAGANPAIDITITDGTLNGIAATINAADAGVTATVVEDAGSFSLVLTANDTGTESAFEITVSDDDGNDSNNQGLSRLTYDHAAGGRLTQTQAARDAAYTINGVAATSTSNANVTIAPGVTAGFLTTGATTITVSQDVENVKAAAQNLVDAYNNLVSATGGLPDSALARDIAGGAERILARTFSGASGAGFLGEIGIGKNADGTLGLDTTVLQNAFNGDAAGVTSLINEAAKAFDDFAEPFTRIGGTIDNASQRLQSQVNFLETRTSGADYALSVLQRQAIQQYSAIMAMATSQ